MQVYVELALAENFCMDLALLLCAKFICKNPCRYRRLAFGAALGAAFAVAFPLFGLSGAPAVAVKIASGLALAAVSGRFSGFRAYIKFASAFLALSFVLGGALVAVFSLAGIEYAQGGGYVLSRIPVGIPLLLAVMLVPACRAFAKKFAARHAKNTVRCVIYRGGRKVEQYGFFDSGNHVYFSGMPVSVISAAAASYIVDERELQNSVKVRTVTGERSMKIFTADKIVIYNGGGEHTIKCVAMGISPRGIGRLVLHPDLSALTSS